MSKSLPKVATQLLPKVPKLGSSPSYKSFFKQVIQQRENRKVITVKGKAAIDHEWESLLRRSRGEPGRASTAPEALKRWREYRNRPGMEYKMNGRAQADAAVAVAGLRLPNARGNAYKRNDLSMNTVWKCANYADFAKNVQKMNPSVTFDKQLMDDAFRASVSAMPAKLKSSTQDQKEIDRVGPPSFFPLTGADSTAVLGQGVDEILEGSRDILTRVTNSKSGLSALSKHQYVRYLHQILRRWASL
ncbi:hypothetical protein CKM354_000797000 [Cercospora kikuchii]|uniref:Uncharacterized protein n=1 Tax=Cercospora kikuchii TaxID=84275 RepID=A0A9P3CM02_9PEZI|nr:uncharacterized protein CKM354_000797000 [Cercospora kikuchii]GIZ44781.1 hypothetical protein CKM354_000797000 [Cercospora kikuchii]